ncbi:MAG TPA: RsmD family RNA methyltransferase [Myxococcales bacterium]|nr:RsmD family RNA methyltransferase [Myxococcales bacterium]
MKATLRIESLVHGGEGLARHEGRVVFVRGGAPGDLVEAELQGGSARFERTRALRVLEPGAAHVAAPCPIVDRCGGCPVQHVDSGAQLAAKSALTADALERIGGVAPGTYQLLPISPSPKKFRYRRRARLHRGKGGTWGFKGDEGVVAVEECLLFEEPLQKLADALRGEDLPGVMDLGLDTSASGKGAVDLRTPGPPSPALRKRARQLLAGLVKGVTLGSEIAGDPVLIDDHPGFRLRSRPDVFSQANRSMVPALQSAALAALGEAVSGRILELFCGSGTLTLPLLLRAQSVVGVESAGPSLQLLRRSADEIAGAAGKLRLVAGDAAEALPGLPGPFDAALLDPPRTGAAEAVRALAKHGIPRIAYVSCDAPTLARDAKLLRDAGYQLVSAHPLDLFPQTAHFEVVAAFVRVSGAWRGTS